MDPCTTAEAVAYERTSLLKQAEGGDGTACTYDLKTLMPQTDGSVLCPECGHSWDLSTHDSRQ